MTNRFAVIGSPIGHSKSPLLHVTAHRVLGIVAEYSAVEVTEGHLRQFANSLDESWVGLSVTMPLKAEATRFSTELDTLAALTGVTNTLKREETGWKGFNTDIFGIQRALASHWSQREQSVLVLGSGATAISAVFAVLLANPRAKISLLARNRQAARDIKARVAANGQDLRLLNPRAFNRSVAKADLVISTLPAGSLEAEAKSLTRSLFYKPKGVLLDVAYDPWPSALVNAWSGANRTVVSGLEMLLFQAIGQLRIFTNDSIAQELDNERAIELAMRDSLGLL